MKKQLDNYTEFAHSPSMQKTNRVTAGVIDYQVIAKERSAIRISRHGYSQTNGGRVIESRSYRWPHTPVYIAKDMMRERHPDCDIITKGLEIK